MRHSRPHGKEIETLARLHGVHTSYLDMARQRRFASPDTLLAVLRAMGVPVRRANDVPDALRETRQTRARRALEPVHVVWRGRPGAIGLQLPERLSARSARTEWRLEDGAVRRRESRLDRLPEAGRTRADGELLVRRLLPVPRSLPTGYHRLRLECADGCWETHVFCAPERCYRNRRRGLEWGLFAPLYALHSSRSWGAGDFADLHDLIAWVASQGGRVVGTLPLLPAFLETPAEPSPYSPVSRLFWNEFYLSLEDVPELASCPPARRRLRSADLQEQLRALRRAPLADFAAQMALKRGILEVLSRFFFTRPSPRRDAFDQFLEARPRLADYARFRAAQEERGRDWLQWPVRLRDGLLRDADCPRASREYHLYVQWLAHEQMTRLSKCARARGVKLYLDMPLGTHRDGYDAWRYRDLFAREASGGAPPDPVFTRAQNWGFAPLHPERCRAHGHGYVRAYVRHHLEQARMLRLDHVMGLHRLYWVPNRFPATEGAYVTYPADEFYAILSIESHRHHAAIVGENLGTVPPVVNSRLERHAIAGMFVLQSELRPPPRPPLRRIPAHAVASLNTHDMPPFAGFCSGVDIADRLDLDLIDDNEAAAARRVRRRLCQVLDRLVRDQPSPTPNRIDPHALFREAVRILGASSARWVLLNLEDLWGETAPQNTPGTSLERVNWSRKARLGLDELRRNARCLALLRALQGLRRAHSLGARVPPRGASLTSGAGQRRVRGPGLQALHSPVL